MSSNNSSNNQLQLAASIGAIVDSPSTESASVPLAAAAAAAAAVAIGLENLPRNDEEPSSLAQIVDVANDNRVKAKDPPLPPSQIATAYDEMDAAIKESIKNPTSGVNVPIPPAQIAAAYDKMDASIKESAELIQAIDDAPLPPSQIARADDEGMGGGEMDLKKRAEPKTGDEDAIDTLLHHQEDSNIHQDKRSAVIAPSISPNPISQGRGQSSLNTRSFRGQRQVLIRPPTQSMMPLTNEATINTPSVPVRAPLNHQPSVPMLEATLVPEIPIYDAVQVPNEGPAADEDEEEQQTWLKRNKKYITFGGVGLLLGLGAAAAVWASFRSNNTADSDESNGDEGISPLSTVHPSESFSPSRDPSLRPTLQPSQSSNPSLSPSTSLRPSLLPSTSNAPTPFRVCGEITILTDQYPEETTWKLSRNVIINGTANLEIFLEGSPKYAGKHREEVCLEKGKYEFSIFDSEGDGICCQYDEGRYEVTMDGVVIARGGEFESVETVSFSLPLPSPSPSKSLSPIGMPSSSLVPSHVHSSPPSTYWSTLYWNQQGQSIYGEEPEDGLGGAVALSADGMTMAIGAPSYWSFHVSRNNLKDRPGYVKVFRREVEGSSWEQLGDTIYGVTNGDGFGRSLSLSDDGETLSVGAPRIDPHEWGSESAGQVSVYKWNKAILNYKQIGDILDGETHDVSNFGRAVDLSSDGKTLAVGASDLVFVYLWDEVDANYRQQGGAIRDPNSAGTNVFGSDLTLSGDGKKLASGAPGYSGGGHTGHVAIFAWDEDSLGYKQLEESIIGDEADESFGFAVSFSDDGSTLAIGAPYGKANVGYLGQVKIFRWDKATSTFKQLGQNIYGGRSDFFGESVSLSSDGKTVAIGARAFVEAYGWDDAALIYKKLGQRLGGGLGTSVAFSREGNVLVAGAWGNDGNGEDSGEAKVFKIEEAF